MVSDPTPFYRLRDGVYAADLLIVAVAELDLFTWLRDHPDSDASAICGGLGLAERPVDVLLTYLVALGLLDRVGERVRPTAAALEHLSEGSVYDLRPYYASIRQRPGCVELLSVLRSGEPAAWASAGGSDDWVSRLDDPGFAGSITVAMDARGRFLGPRLAAALDHLPMSAVLDIGGSSGIYLSSVVARRAQVRGAVLERAPVDRAARTLLRARGDDDRVDVVTADMFVDPFPAGFNVHLFSHVLHDWDEDRVRMLVAKSFQALTPGGWFVDHDVHINADKTGPLPAAEYSVFLMHATPGKSWSVTELASMLREAGFVDVSASTTAGDRSVIIARKPV